MASMDEQQLSGGNMGGAVRVGDTVRKPGQAQTATIQRLVAHVRAQGVMWVPEPLGIDNQGRAVWSFIYLKGAAKTQPESQKLTCRQPATLAAKRQPGESEREGERRPAVGRERERARWARLE